MARQKTSVSPYRERVVWDKGWGKKAFSVDERNDGSLRLHYLFLCICMCVTANDRVLPCSS